MLFLQILLLVFFAVAVPFLMGAGAASFVNTQRKNIWFMWTAGYLLFFAAFQLMAVPLILTKSRFTVLVWLFLVFCVAAALTGGFVWLYRNKKYPQLSAVRSKPQRAETVLWAVFCLILAVQLFLAAALAFADGDDAYYVAVSTVTEASDTMYLVLPYTGGSTGLDSRHGLAPFPLLIAFFARVSGIHPAAVAHTAMPLVLIPLTYCIYGLIGSRLFKGKRLQLPIFMIFVELLVMWGNYSLYTAETFLMTRTRQGKAALGNIIIPALFLLLYMVGERLSENRKIEKSLWALIAVLMTASCLCSTLGGFLIAVLLFVFGLCAVCSYRKWRLLLPLFLCVMPGAFYIGLYIVLQ